MSTSGSQDGKSPSQLIDARIEELGDWRGELLARLRALIKQADPEVVEEWKWRGVPVWEHDGMICTGESYKNYVKLTFAKGASLDDPAGLFNSSLEGNTRRAIDFHEGAKIDEKALKALVKSAIALNQSKAKPREVADVRDNCAILWVRPRSPAAEHAADPPIHPPRSSNEQQSRHDRVDPRLLGHAQVVGALEVSLRGQGLHRSHSRLPRLRGRGRGVARSIPPRSPISRSRPSSATSRPSSTRSTRHRS